MSPVCDAILALASSGVRSAESNGVSKRESGITGAFNFPGSFFMSGARRSLRVLNSNFSKSGVIKTSSGPFHASASTSKFTGASWTNCVSSRLRITLSMLSRKDWPTLPPKVSTLASSSLSEPKSTIHFAAVFSPTPGTDGKLSLGSPRSAAKSGYCSAVIPYLSMIAWGVIRAISLTPRLGYKMVVAELTNWKLSLSPVQINTSHFSFSACFVIVAIMSSASYPSISYCWIPKAVTKSCK